MVRPVWRHGWSTFNSRPTLRGSKAADWELELKPGYGLNVAAWILDKDERMGVWIGDAVVLTESGVRRLHRSPVDQLADNILAD